MKPIDKRLLMRYILVNIFASSLLVLLLWYAGKFKEGLFFYIGLVLYIPIFCILVFIQGLNKTMHFTAYHTELFVGFIFYSAVISLIQIVIYKIRKKKEVRGAKDGADFQT